MSAYIVLLSAWLFIHDKPVADINVPTLAHPLSTHGSGLQADYYNGMHFEKKVFSRIEKQINFSFLGEAPAPGVHTEDFSVRWTGKLFAPESGVYKFRVRADDGVRIWLGNQLILDEWHLQQETFYERKVQLKANHFYDLKVEYYNHELHAVMQLYWIEPPKTGR
ncbi:MAG: PA14 domain-containing protein, partial [Bacteroidota bacterium]